MSRTERVVRVAVGVVMLACAQNFWPNLWAAIPALACGSMMTLSGVLGWCPPIFGRAQVPEHNAFGLPDARVAADIDLSR